MVRALLFLAVLFLSLTGPGAQSAAAQGVTIDGLAASVNGEVITLLELEKAGRPLVEKSLRTALKREQGKVKREVLTTVLEQLILRTLQQQRARELGLRVGDTEIETAIARIMETNALTEEMLERALAEEGMSREEYDKQISDQILFTKLMQREVREKLTVTPEEVESYYEDHKEDYFRPERIRVRHLLVKVDDGDSAEEIQEARRRARGILEEYSGGEDFSALINKHSPETTTGEDNVSGWLKKGEFLQELEGVAFALPVDSVSDPIRSQAGFHLIQLVDRQEEAYLSLAVVEESIREKVGRAKMEQDYKEWLDQLRADSQIEILY